MNSAIKKLIVIDKVVQFKLEDSLIRGEVYKLILDNGQVKFVEKYSESKHLIWFRYGEVRDLYVIVNHIESYTILVDVPEEVPDPQITKQNKTFSLYALAKGKPGKKYTIKNFLDIYKKSKKREPQNPSFEIELDDGYIYQGDSKEEKTAIKKLIKHNAFKRLRGQAPGIDYQYADKPHTYYPDFFLITNTNKIVIVEIKQIAQMNSKENKVKYKALAKYCAKNGFLYMMCDKSFATFESLDKKKGSAKVDNAIENALDDKGCFDYSDYLELIEGLTYKKVKWMRKAIGIYVSSHKNVKMIGDLTFNIKKLKIKIKKKNEK